MQRSKLFYYLNGFQSEDWKNFDRYLRKNHDRSSELVRLYHYVMNYKGDLESEKLNIDVAHKKLAKNIPRKSFQNIMSKLVKEINQYFIYEDVEATPMYSNLHLLNALKRRGLYDQCDKLASAVQCEVEAYPLGIWKELVGLIINHGQFFSHNPIKNHEGKELLEKCQRFLLSFSQNLNEFYKAVSNHFTKIKGLPIDEPFWNGPFELDSHNELITTWVNSVNKVSEDPTDQNLDEALEVFFEHLDRVDLELQSSALVILATIAAHKVSGGRTRFLYKLKDLHLVGFNKGHYLVNNVVTGLSMLNVVTLLGIVGDYEEARSLVEKFKVNLIPEERPTVVALCNADTLICEGRFEDALDKINQADPNFIYFGLAYRRMSLQAYFSLYKDDKYFMDAQFKNYFAFINNNRSKYSEKNYLGGLNFATILKDIYQGKDMDLISEKLSKEEYCDKRFWLAGLIGKSDPI